MEPIVLRGVLVKLTRGNNPVALIRYAHTHADDSWRSHRVELTHEQYDTLKEHMDQEVEIEIRVAGGK